MRALALLIMLLAVPLTATAEDGRVPGPNIPKAKGERCVADTVYMRRYHMTELKHQRDETVHLGIRTKRFSLKECVACHATIGADGQPVAVDAPGQFCDSCHEYAAVTIDCFQCHATKPESDRSAGLPEPLPMTAAAAREAGG